MLKIKEMKSSEKNVETVNIVFKRTSYFFKILGFKSISLNEFKIKL